MDDLPTENSDRVNEAPQDNPLFQTIEAMQRLKEKNTVLEETVKNMGIVIGAQQVRIKNIEDAFQIACKDTEGPLKDFFDELKAKESHAEESGEEETDVEASSEEEGEEGEASEARIGEEEETSS